MTPILSQDLDLDQQIKQLETEVVARQKDTNNLREALTTLESGKPRPADPSTDDVFKLLQQMIGSVPEQLEQRQVYQEKLAAAKKSLQLSVEACQQKSDELEALYQERRSQQAGELLQELVAKAHKFNSNIDEAVVLLEGIQELNQRLNGLRDNGKSPVLRISPAADLRELPWFQVIGDEVVLRRRFDVLRGS